MARQKAFDEALLLERAMELFWQRGYEATSVRDLCDYLEISNSSLYNTYGGKRELYLAALAAYRRIELEQIEALLASAGSGREALRQLFVELIEELRADEKRRGSFTLNAAVELGTRDAAVLAQLQEHFADVTALLTTYLAAAQKRNEIDSKQGARELAAYFLLNLYSLATMAKLNASREEMEQVARVALSVVE
jgi:TetR/AcrR family transcriptional repressor of nem operon